MRNFFPTRMPEVNTQADLASIFRQARELASSAQTRQIVVVTPERTLVTKNCPPPGTATLGMKEAIRKIVPFDPPVNISVIAYTETKFFQQDPSACIPFLGYLMGMGYMGHTVVIFEGHSSALLAGLQDAELLLIDEGMTAYLPTNWTEIAQSHMRRPRVLTFNRSGKFETRPLRPVENLPPHDYETFLRHAHRLAKEGKFSEAVAAYTKALEFKPDSEQAFYNRGFVQMKLGNLDKAIEDFTKALTLKPASFEALFQRGVAYAQKDNFQGAFSDLNQALKLNRRSSLAYYHRGKILAQKQKWEAAIIDFSTSIDLKPTLEALLDRAGAYEAAQQVEAALSDYEQFLRVGGDKRFGNRAEIEGKVQQLKNALSLQN